MHVNIQRFNELQHFKCMYRQKAGEKLVSVLILNFYINPSVFLFGPLMSRWFLAPSGINESVTTWAGSSYLQGLRLIEFLMLLVKVFAICLHVQPVGLPSWFSHTYVLTGCSSRHVPSEHVFCKYVKMYLSMQKYLLRLSNPEVKCKEGNQNP